MFSLAAFHPLEVLYSGSLLTSSNRPVSSPKPKSTIEERNKAPACFQIATLRLSYSFVYIANRITVPFHSQAFLIRLRQDPTPDRSRGGPIMHTNTLNH